MICSFLSTAFLLIIINTQTLAAVDTETAGAECGKQKSTWGYEYNELFKFSDKSYTNGTLYLTFRVQAASNAHVILSIGPTLDSYAQIYEIVLGAGRNTFTDIRRYVWQKGPASRARVKTEDLLSATELREFTVSIAKDGLIEIRKGSEAIPILYWKDPDPLPISYFGFSTWTSVYGIWYFDCYGAGSTTIDRPRTFTESLRRDLLKEYDRFSIPYNISDDWTPINISFNPYHVELDPQHEQITLVGTFMLAWKDEKLKWDPASYGNITSLQLVHGEIWKPELVLYNAVGHGVNPLGASGMVVSNKGEVNWNPNSRLQSRCPLEYTSLLNEKHKCELQIGLWATQNIFRLVWINDSTENNKQTALYPWLFKDFNATTKWIETPWYDDKGNEDLDINGKSNNTVLVLAITLQANNDGFYLYTVSSSSLVIAFLFLVSFWMPSCDDFRFCIYLGCCSLILPIYKFMALFRSRTYPVLDITYGFLTLLIALAAIASMYAAYLKSRPGGTKPNSAVLWFVRLRLMERLFCLPGIDRGDGNYDGIVEDGNRGEGEEGNRGGDGGNGEWYAQEWKAISTLVTRITFYVSLFSLIWFFTLKFD